MKKLLLGLAIASLLLGGLVVGPATAQAPFRIELELDKSSYVLGDPINVTLRVVNTTGGTVITADGFTQTPFHLTLRFLRSDGVEILAPPQSPIGAEGPPPRNIDGVQAEAVEFVTDQLVYSRVFDARTYYNLTTPAFYRVRSEIQVTVYTEDDLVKPGFARIGSGDVFTIASGEVPFSITADQDLDGFFAPVGVPAGAAVDCNDNNPFVKPGAAEVPGNGVDDDCNALTSDVVAVPTGTIDVKVQDTSTKPAQPGAFLPVRAYRNSKGSCSNQFEPTRARTFFDSVWLSCVPEAIETTDSAGRTSLTLPASEDYVVITEYVDATKGIRHAGKRAPDLDPGETLRITLDVETQ